HASNVSSGSGCAMCRKSRSTPKSRDHDFGHMRRGHGSLYRHRMQFAGDTIEPKRGTGSRRFGSIFGALSFGLVAATGVLSFATPYSEPLSRVHTVAGIVFIASAFLHISHNGRALLRYLQARRRPLPSRALALALVTTSAALTVALSRVRPVSAFFEWGEALRE